jgi:hypothetical protein
MNAGTHDPIKLMADFEQFLSGSYNVGHILPSEEYQQRQDASLSALPLLINIAKPFLNSAKSLDRANEIPIPNYGQAICFPSRFLGKSSIDELPNQVSEKLSNAIDIIFFSGLKFHLFWATFPTRKEYKNVHAENLKSQWLLEAILSDQTMKNFYTGEGGAMSKDIFEKYYTNHCLGLLKNDLKIGFFKRGICKSFFRNIYWAGALLGVQYDMATKQKT